MLMNSNNLHGCPENKEFMFGSETDIERKTR
jgi:hypothetical protein